MPLRHALVSTAAALGLLLAGSALQARPAQAGPGHARTAQPAAAAPAPAAPARGPRPSITGALPNTVVPAPASTVATGPGFTLTTATGVTTDTAAGTPVADHLARILRTSTGFPVPVATTGGTSGTIALLLSGAPPTVGAEGYQLTTTATGVVIRATHPAGLFHGVQTLLQLLPAKVMAKTAQPGPWAVPGGIVTDRPRFGYRGAMLDVARHFFTVAQVKRYIDQLALYKINALHLHLSDDQGWRIAIDSWPNLAAHGGSTQVGGGPGGHYTKADYSAIVAYAAARYITVVPEIDMPGHTNAALASYARLNCNGVAPPLYTGTNVGFSSLCVPLEVTYDFIDDVIGEIAALTPGPWIHIGGDEASSTTPADYRTFIGRAQQTVARHGKTVVGWHDVTNATLLPGTVAQYWGTGRTHAATAAAAARGTKVIMSPANVAYLDMKYDRNTPLGLSWAGYIEVNKAYDWNPATRLDGVGEASVAGVEAPLWSETLVTSAHIDYMAFPRLPALAELGWSPWSTHDVGAFDERLAAQGPRWKALGINYHRSPQIRWPAGS
ncbi:beta-N-acetylhexosaminidase [Streptomyces bambusae]|uniref:beta-N-acetylhexosaminidase n=1 Tax=Streptomyces bambusae TaxID=1550616 RepID=UPI001CFF28FF|nr:beta-N-acetylhexosaminidase [Streptomyces bambusae]MCB5165374.1 beta-N-acetylhexosaminidase [Streptomyces bambusae]